MSQLDVWNIQGNVIRGYKFPLANYVFFRIDDAVRARAWLEYCAYHVTTSGPWDEKPASTFNIAFTYAGLQALEVPNDSLALFAREFREGMRARAAGLGDTEESHPDRWDEEWQSGQVHVMVTLNALHRGALDERLRWLHEVSSHTGGVTEVTRQEAHSLPDWTEHFGYNDGFGQPSIDGTDKGPDSGRGRINRLRQWVPLKPGEFILGYHDEEELIPSGPLPRDLSDNATYVVYRKLYQNVASFRRMLAEQARGYPGGEALLAAKLVGRWQDGTPLSTSPDRPIPGIADDPHRASNFRYGDDLDGVKCPRGAHIRRANPRDIGGATVRRHRLIRRGLPYGELLPPGTVDDGADRGLLFISFQASILRQFEFIQAEWLNNGNPFHLGDDKDVISGDNDGTGKMIIPGRPPRFVARVPRLVETRGGEYFFMPGINGLHWLAADPAVQRSTRIVASPPQSLVRELEMLPERLEDRVAGVSRAAIARIERHEEEHPRDAFATLRHVRPILLSHGFALVTRWPDVLEVLGNHKAFGTTLYDQAFERVTGPVTVGEAQAPLQFLERAEPFLVGTYGADRDMIATITLRAAREAIVAAAGNGRLDLIAELTDHVCAVVAAEYLGVPGPDEETLVGWARLLFNEVFVNVRREPTVTARSEAAADEMRSYLDNLIEARQQARPRATGDQQDTVLDRLLTSGDDRGQFDNEAIRNQLMRLVILLLPGTSKAMALAMEELLRRPATLASAQAAAQRGQNEEVAAYVFEAMRFAPHAHGIFRTATDDVLLAAGTSRATTIPVGTLVFAATQSALLDPHQVPHPHRFDSHRDVAATVNLGLGVYGRFARSVSQIQVPLMGVALLEQLSLRRASGLEGKLSFQGPFPNRMLLEFGVAPGG